MSNLISYPELLLVGATGQNRGKTHFVCSVIKKFSGTHVITALKISSLLEEEKKFHKREYNFEQKQESNLTYIDGSREQGFILYREDNSTGFKDSQVMLRAGAKYSYYLKANEKGLIFGWKALSSLIKEDTYIVCEAGRLRNILKPALFFMIQKTEEASGDVEVLKQSSKKLLKLADKIILTDGKVFHFNFDLIAIENGKWKLN